MAAALRAVLVWLIVASDFTCGISLVENAAVGHPKQSPTALAASKYQRDAPFRRHSIAINEHWRYSRKTRAADAADAADAAIDDRCERFVSPNIDNNTFFSPSDPKSALTTYPPSMDCTFTLEAPAGQIIKLDFRNTFYIEPSPNCEFDYLEVHDGKHGYAKELGRFCTDTFPNIVYSSDRYLWLHFHSDENIEYEGFQAVYEYLPRPNTSMVSEEPCIFNRNGSEGFIMHSDISTAIIEQSMAHNLSVDCLWRIEVEPKWSILLFFALFDLDKKNECESNFIDVFGESTDIPSRLKNFCGVIAEPVVSKTNVLHVRFFAEHYAVNKTKFNILFTAIRTKQKGEDCSDDEFDCEDDTCIHKDLECNNNKNCKFQKDESDCDSNASADKSNLTVIIVVFCLILAAMISAFLFNCIRKLIRDQKIIREHIRQSKESKLDEAGRISLKRSLENINRIAPSNKSVPPAQPRHMQTLDSDSNRYYQEHMPPGALDMHSRIDIKNDHNFRNLEIKDSYNASIPSDKKCSENGGGENNVDGDDDDDNGGGGSVAVGGNNTCDMACQTRSSLFGPSPSRDPSTMSHGPLRFSTFGYDDAANSRRPASSNTSSNSYGPSGAHAHQHHQHQHQHHQHHPHAHQMTPDGIPPPPPPAVAPPGSQCYHISAGNCAKHKQHQAHQAKQQQPTRDKSSKKPMEESRIYVDIRNSAPDVIIMTSH